MINLIVFDLDGTLVDSRGDLAAAANELLRRSNAPTLDEAAIGRMVGEGAGVLVRRAFEAAGAPAPADALPRFLDLYGERLLETTHPYPGVTELLAGIDGRAPMAILTNKPRAMAEEVLAGLGLRRYFVEVFGGDAPYPRKPDPRGLLALVQGAGTAAGQAVLVGDSVTDLRTARAAGTHICLVRYGFGFDNVPAGELQGDEWLIDAPPDLTPRLHLYR